MASVTAQTVDTRGRIKQVALELFSEQGYEQTALREIAERLGVTKAALYYHFKTKEEIVEAFAEDWIATVEEMARWLDAQPPGRETRLDFVRRYAAQIDTGRHHSIMRFFQENQPALKGTPTGKRMRERMLTLVDVLAGPDPSPADKLRTAFSLFVLHGSWTVLRETAFTDEQRSAAALEVALELADHA